MQGTKKTFVVVAVLLVLVVPATVILTAARNYQSPKKPDDATPIQEGVLTEKQKAHSKLFKKYDDVTRGRTLSEQVETLEHDLIKHALESAEGSVTYAATCYTRGTKTYLRSELQCGGVHGNNRIANVERSAKG